MILGEFVFIPGITPVSDERDDSKVYFTFVAGAELLSENVSVIMAKYSDLPED